MKTSCLLLLAVLLPRPLAAQTPENVLLLVSENSEDSKAIARYYAEKRGVAPRNICRIHTTEEMGQLMRSEVKSGHADLAQAVLKAAQRWCFEPQLVNGRPEASRLLLPLNSN